MTSLTTQSPWADATAARRYLTARLYDPVRFANYFLRASLWPAQAAILRSVASHPRTAVKACHASGKSFVASCAALWWISRFPDGVVITTAPSWVQVQRVLWGEIKKAVARAKIVFPPILQTEIKHRADNYAMGLSTNEGVRFQGFHGRVLIILDEAPGVKPEIWESIEGIRAGGDVRLLAIGNPTVPSGPFYDAFTSQRESWSTMTISAFDCPNLAGLDLEALRALPDEALDENRRPYLVTRRWVREKWSEWGAGHPLWDARVLGNFPTQADNALISLAWLEAASERPAADTGGSLQAGIDVAGPGEDETVLCIVDGPSIVTMQAWGQPDPRGLVAAALAPYRGRIERVHVDTVGIGYYMARHLADLGFPAYDVNVGLPSTDPEKYANAKAELYWGLRLRFQAGDVAGLNDQTAISQLAGILYAHNARGQIVIESKEQARKRGVKSPDRAEALMLAFAAPRAAWTVLDALPEDERRGDPIDRQLQDRVMSRLPPVPTENCGGCGNAAPRGGNLWCEARGFIVRAKDLACDRWEGA